MSKSERRLAAIVAVDIVGYSAMTERNAEGAAAAVRAVRGEIDKSARRFEGRVFSTAGDGFMLEFNTSRDALAFGIDLLRRLENGPPVRIGADLGEVLTTETGDLLGHGVNVAARLMALADPRGLMASDALKAQLSGRLSRLFLHQGPVQLDKMRSTVQVYGLAGAIGPVGRMRLAVRRPWRAALGAGLALAIAGAAWFAAQDRDAAPMIAVMPFEAAQDAQSQRIAEGVADDVIISLSRAHGVDVASRESSFALSAMDGAAAARKLGARYLLDGVVRGGGDGVWRIDAHMIDARSKRTLWAESFETQDGHVSLLQQQIAAAALGAVTGVAQAGVADPDQPPEDVYALYIEGRRARLTRQPAQVAFAIGVLEDVVSRAPRFARGWAELAGARLIRASQLAGADGRDDDAVAHLQQDARIAADRALALDPRNGYALAVLAGLEPLGRWSATRALLDRAVEAAPSDANVLRARGVFLSDVGYFDLALADLERARALDPLDPQIALIWTLEALGGRSRARTLLAQGAQTHPEETWRTRFLFALFDRDFPAAETLMRSNDRPTMDEAIEARWRDMIAALRRDRAARTRAVNAWLEDARQNPRHAEDAVFALALLGARDEAFAAAQAVEGVTPMIAGDAAQVAFRADIAATPAISALMRDPRFESLMAKSDLTGYWRANGYPEMCRQGAACGSS